MSSESFERKYMEDSIESHDRDNNSVEIKNVNIVEQNFSEGMKGFINLLSPEYRKERSENHDNLEWRYGLSRVWAWIQAFDNLRKAHPEDRELSEKLKELINLLNLLQWHLEELWEIKTILRVMGEVDNIVGNIHTNQPDETSRKQMLDEEMTKRRVRPAA